MNAKQLLELIITPTHKFMEGNYQSDSADLLSLCTAAIESDCGHFIKQVDGPALGIWQMEPSTDGDIWDNCDALKNDQMQEDAFSLLPKYLEYFSEEVIKSSFPMYSCFMARLKYSMDPNPLPEVTGNRKVDERAFYDYYKRVYNTILGKSTLAKWQEKMEKHKVFEVFYESRGYSK